MEILKDYFRNASKKFLVFVKEYDLFTYKFLQYLKEYSDEKMKKKDYTPVEYEDYRKILNILSQIANPNYVHSIQGCGQKIENMATSYKPKDAFKAIINKTDKIEPFIKKHGPVIENLYNLGNMDAHCLSIQEENSNELIREFVTTMKCFVDDFPADKEYEKEAKEKAVNELNEILNHI